MTSVPDGQATQAPFIAAMLIPTGIGARIGGFGGDATPWLNLLATCCDTIITHPNVANAAVFQQLPPNALYVEGYALDRFWMGELALRPTRSNRVGVILDAGVEPRMRTLHLNAIHAVQTVYGVCISSVEETAQPLSLSLHDDPSGAASGSVTTLEPLLAACRRAIANGAQALAIAARMPPSDSNAYKAGNDVDPIAGLEALLSHAVSEAFGLPCAHAPVFDEADAAPAMDTLVDPRAASEFIAPTFLPCVLTGLARAPQLAPTRQNALAQGERPPATILAQDVSALIVPADALGGAAVWQALERDIAVIAVQDNATRMRVDAAALGAPRGIIEAASYFEAAGVLQALRHGVASAQVTRRRAGALPEAPGVFELF
ncbi:MAG: DUF3326 domain-containing protein [Vampirovibrionales bacterium]|nr:DUF3326 domain-containing protein [Vampirovibrionales bacterium]